MGSRAKRNFSARLLPESNVEKKRLEFVGKWSARGDEPLDPQEGRGLVFFVVVAGAQVLGGGVIRDFAQSEKTTIDLEAGYYDISSEEFPEDMWEGHDFLVFVAGTKANPITANTRVRIICGSLTQTSANNNRIYLDNFYIRRLQEVEEDYFAENNGSGRDIILGAPFDEEGQE